MQTTSSLTATAETELSATASIVVAALRDQLARETRVAVDGRAAQAILGCSASQLANKVRDGSIPSFLDGAKRLYPVVILFNHLIQKAIETHPLGSPSLKARHPKGQFQKRIVRKRTAAQLAALKRGNETRIARRRAVAETI